MAYSTPDDIKKLIPEADLIQLTDDEGTGQVITSRVDEAIDQADREIDGYIGTVREVPLDPVPGLIQNLSAKMAIYYLYGRRARQWNEIPEVWQGHYENAISLLEKIARGLISLGMPTETGPAGGGGAPSISTSTRQFTREAMDLW